ncbi:CAMK family protein kinase [Tritrichomonas foetus]|uniref:CAMK family protein kinase n=1 Tax=Tritrichomonas foetus TaxID=1144522 RepID=A0A1J4JJH2_9EUKA|nr:CAMK family protein kinase [Tritrichomonas foetus]|eukprot:OHS97396.1 CAMK family protein kinase [Tritrichomonas foetus]
MAVLQGFPVPDFDCFDDEDTLYDEPICCYSQPLSIITDEDVTLCEKKGLVLDTATPIKCTANSTVYTAKSPRDGKIFAVKFTDHKRRIQSEFSKRKQVKDSPYLLKSFALQESPSKAMLQMEFCENGDIRDLIMPENYIWKLIHDIGNALYNLHSDGWMHLDVSPGNILVSKNCFKLSDFGTLARIGEFEEGMEGAGPYASPEALAFPLSDFQVTQQTDIFSFGVCLLESASGKAAPRGGSNGYSLLRNDQIKLGQGEYTCWCSTELINVINSMLNSNPNKRPTSEDLINLPQVKKYDL